MGVCYFNRLNLLRLLHLFDASPYLLIHFMSHAITKIGPLFRHGLGSFPIPAYPFPDTYYVRAYFWCVFITYQFK